MSVGYTASKRFPPGRVGLYPLIPVRDTAWLTCSLSLEGVRSGVLVHSLSCSIHWSEPLQLGAAPGTSTVVIVELARLAQLSKQAYQVRVG